MHSGFLFIFCPQIAFCYTILSKGVETMSDISVQEKLLAEFTEEYMEKIFYFCLKKTDSNFEAEDLTQDIAINVFCEINKGTVPVCFSAWIWQIVRNRYSVWAKKKHLQTESIINEDISECDIIDDSSNMIDGIIKEEQLSLLRRELAFIKDEYRDILVAYYIDDMSVRQISENVSLPVETVKKRLQRARNILKEGMNMAREFGKLSYKPETVFYEQVGCSGSKGEPFCCVGRMLCSNLLLAAYRTPSTAEDLAMEVGVALPYTEQELELLVSATLMRKNGNKYETNFMIISADAQNKISTHLRSISGELTSKLIQLTEIFVELLNRIKPGWYGTQPYEDAKWTLLLSFLENGFLHSKEMLLNDNYSDLSKRTVRPNNGYWDIIGREAYDTPIIGVASHYTNNFCKYVIHFKDMATQTPDFLSGREVNVLNLIAKQEDYTEYTTELANLEKYGYIKKNENGYSLAIVVFDGTGMSDITEEQFYEFISTEDQDKAVELSDDIRALLLKQKDFSTEQILNEIPEFLKNDTKQIEDACNRITPYEGVIIEEALKQGYLHYDENEPKRILGAFLELS